MQPSNFALNLLNPSVYTGCVPLTNILHICNLKSFPPNKVQKFTLKGYNSNEPILYSACFNKETLHHINEVYAKPYLNALKDLSSMTKWLTSQTMNAKSWNQNKNILINMKRYIKSLKGDPQGYGALKLQEVLKQIAECRRSLYCLANRNFNNRNSKEHQKQYKDSLRALEGIISEMKEDAKKSQNNLSAMESVRQPICLF